MENKKNRARKSSVFVAIYSIIMVARLGIEPRTQGFSVPVLSLYI